MASPGFKCRYCRRPMNTTEESYAENPFCKECLCERFLSAERNTLKEDAGAVRELCRPVIGDLVDPPPDKGGYMFPAPSLAWVVERTIEKLSAAAGEENARGE